MRTFPRTLAETIAATLQAEGAPVILAPLSPYEVDLPLEILTPEE